MTNKSRLTQLRLSRGWTQEYLAEVCNLSVRTIQRIEVGDNASPETLRLISQAFQVNVTELFDSVSDDDHQEDIARLAAAQAQQARQRKLDNLVFKVYKICFIIIMLAVGVFLLDCADEALILPAFLIWLFLTITGCITIRIFRLTWWENRLNRRYPLSYPHKHTKGLSR